MRRRLVAHQADIEQRGDAGMAAPRHHLQPLRHQRAVHPGQRHDVADGGQRHQVQQFQQRRLRPALEDPFPPQHPVQSRSQARKATAAAHRCRRPELQSSRFGFTAAATCGTAPSALWWSSTMTSARPRAASSASCAAMPQSTQTISVAPRSQSVRIALAFGP